MKPKDITVSFYNQGCRLNIAETATMSRQFQGHDFNVVDFKSGSDIVVVNTCTVTENGDSDTRKLVNKINRMNPDVKIALVGCQAQILKEQLLKLPNVHWVIGNAEKFNLSSLINANGIQAEPTVLTPKIERGTFTVLETSIDPKHTRANLKIQDGCDFYCAFCVIPFARGPARSRVFEDILDEAQVLAVAGHQEVVLTGVNIGTYEDRDYRFMDVIDGLDKINGIKRIRISSIEPTTIPYELFDRMADPNSKVCPHLHIPLQAGTDEVLALMKRKYTLKEFDDFINYAHKTVPDICIGTDIIVGFPGETQALFDSAAQYLRDSVINYAHVFQYSERKFARSKNFEGQVSTDDKPKRSQILREISARKRRVFDASFVGREVDVLFEQKKKNIWHGLTSNYIKVKFQSDEMLRNQFLNVKIDGHHLD